ncbi:hypothetical protein ACERII_07370 [Evansella sp. AB-rgal1]|uniref:hypothetical protein n=1 Tax=Evansella sp. AB-rgal1 TaxID=3242696 RepID=UPI00359CFF51
MAQSKIYFRDNFFSSGMTEIYNGDKERVGSLDLKSAFTSRVEVLDKGNNVIVKGHFPLLTFGWVITDGNDNELGKLRQRISFFTKRYEYEARGRGVYKIHSEAFSKEYEVTNEADEKVVEFRRLSGFFESPVYQLVNNSDKISNEEAIAIVMGVNMITKRNNNSAAR